MCSVSLARDLSPALPVQRAGVIPYTVVRGERVFCFGVDKRFGELTDFGGSLWRRETYLRGAIRELREESFNLFTPSQKDIIKSGSVVYDESTAIVFHYVTADVKSTREEFAVRFGKSEKPENSDILWIPEGILSELLLVNTGGTYSGENYPRFYKRIFSLLKYALDHF